MLTAGREDRRLRLGAARLVVTVVVVAVVSGSAAAAARPTGPRPPQAGGVAAVSAGDARAQAADAYVWGVPLVITLRTIETFARAIPVNQFTWQTSLAGPGPQLVVAPNHDTLYLAAPVDLRGGPLVLTVPAVPHRYYTIQMLDAYTNVFAYVGTRATGAMAGRYAITPPGWRGTLPRGVAHLVAPTPQVFLLGRVLVADEHDIPGALALRPGFRLESLRATPGRPASAPPRLPTPVAPPQRLASAGVAFFDELGDDLALDPPPSATERRFVARLATIGVGPGRHPSRDVADPTLRADLGAGIQEGQRRVASAIAGQPRMNGWSVNLRVGQYGGDYLLRALTAITGWGANSPKEAVYAYSRAASDGAPYDGRSPYVVHFAPSGVPPVKAFWSLTLYGPDLFLVANPIDRYAVGDRTPGLVRNADGSLDVYLQHDAPAGHVANWLPTPAGGFVLVLRLYRPGASILNGRYRYPTVRRG